VGLTSSFRYRQEDVISRLWLAGYALLVPKPYGETLTSSLRLWVMK